MKEILLDLAAGLSLLIGIFIFVAGLSLWYWAWKSGRKDKNRSE